MTTPVQPIRRVIVPEGMENIHDDLGYAPAVRVGDLVFCSGQVGRDAQLTVIEDAASQIEACWDNVETVLKAAGCTLHDVVDMTTFHVDMPRTYGLFKEIKNRRFPRGLAAWTAIGVHSLSRPGLLVEIKCIAHASSET
jgi:enamine deaminase RidA (YjgF/YER057c/UK114 family)